MDAAVGRTVTQSLSIFKGNFVSGTKVKDLDGESSLDYASEPSLITWAIKSEEQVSVWLEGWEGRRRVTNLEEGRIGHKSRNVDGL